ncbi:unnamed protein product [Eruca vesicaria subsp. sativa]|uniref:Uncharacterized protein n=1 Tax=Eruca vesicaria subsp. sativa TaxID=29727 RepID=A0ABC8KEY0_ERUVS|nr:unnamed protein product [Eruca vesicaria subsp. sativa]
MGIENVITGGLAVINWPLYEGMLLREGQREDGKDRDSQSICLSFDCFALVVLKDRTNILIQWA